MPHRVDVCMTSSKGVFSVPLAGNSLKVVDTRGDLAFIYIKVNARHLAKLINEFKKGYHLFNKVGDESSVIRVPFVGEL